MSGSKQSLQAGERAVLRLRPHPVVYLRAAIWAVLAAMLAAGAILSRDPLFWTAAGLLVAGAAVAAALEAAFRRRTTELTVTDRRVLLTHGVVRRRLAEVFPAAISGFESSQGPLGRALGYALVRVRGLGEPAPWLALPEPERLREAVEALALDGIASAEDHPETPAPPAARPLGRVEYAAAHASLGSNGAVQPNLPLTPQAQLDRF